MRLWMYDLAREQAPTREFLDRLARVTLEGGYDGLGLYLEHRFAYPSAPWGAGKDALTARDVEWLRERHPTLRLIPFVNLLGHSEGLLYTEAGHRYAAERFHGMQADPTNTEWVTLCRSLIDDVIDAFPDELIHIGGDETWQLGLGKGSEAAVARFADEGVADPKARLYGEHFGPLADHVVSRGRTPGVWGDMFFDHPDALTFMPKETVIFDWQYFKSPLETSAFFARAGYPTVSCPALRTYDAAWCHLPQGERNVRDARDAQAALAAAGLPAAGVCVTTWECGMFGNYETMLPHIVGCGKILQAAPTTPLPEIPAPREDPTTLKGVQKDPDYDTEAEAPFSLAEYLATTGEAGEEWAKIMGIEFNRLDPYFGATGHRSKLKSRLVLFANPFLLYTRDRDLLTPELCERGLELCERAMAFAQGPSQRGVTGFVKAGLQFMTFARQAHAAYASGRPGEAAAALVPARTLFDDLATIARATHLNAGGSPADIERCKIAKAHVERVIARIKEYGDGSLGYLPSFETLTHPKFVPHDQANWWLINRWGNE